MAGQISLPQTSLSNAIDSTSGTLTVASTTNVASGNIIVIDQEAMVILSFNPTTKVVKVQRGQFGTRASGHNANSTVWTGSVGFFLEFDPSGSCTASQVVVPSISLPTGTQWNCTAGLWTNASGGGGAANPGGSNHQVQTNLNGTAFAGIDNGVAGQVLISNGPGADPTMQDPIVSGPAAEGATPVNNPVWIAGKGADGFIHSIRMANDGTVRIDPSGTTNQPVSQATGTNLHMVCDSGCSSSAGFGDNTAFTAGTTAVNPVAGVFNDGLAAVTSGNAAAARLTSDRSLYFNFHKLAGSAVDVNSGTKSAGTLRVVLATDQPQLTNKLLVTPDSVALPANQSVNAAQLAGTTTDTNSGAKSAGTLRVVLATDQPQLTNKLLVTPDSVALPANQSTNVAQVAGTATDTNSGTKSAGTIRVVLATDQPALTNKLLVTPDSVALPANQSVNMAQAGGTNISSGTGASGAGIPRVTVANDSSLAANQSVNESQINGVTVQMGAGASGTGTQRVMLASDSALAANQSVNLNQLGGTGLSGANVVDVGNTAFRVNCVTGCTAGGSFSDSTAFTFGVTAVGNMGAVVDDVGTNTVAENSAGAPRMSTSRVLYTNPRDGSGNEIASSTSQPLGSERALLVREAQKGQGTMANSAPVNIAYDQSAIPVTIVAALNPRPSFYRMVGTFNRPITSTGDAVDVNVKYPPASVDPCSGPNKANLPISLTANTKLLSGTSGTIKVCSIFLLSTSAETFSMVEGTGATCATGIKAVIGSTTAANGPSLAANGGFTLGNGLGSVAMQNVPGNDLCILISGATLIAGNLMYAF